MTAPAYLGPVRAELHQLRATVTRVERLADSLQRRSDRIMAEEPIENADVLAGSLHAASVLIREALADKEPTR